jgi:hypothetical protein
MGLFSVASIQLLVVSAELATQKMGNFLELYIIWMLSWILLATELLHHVVWKRGTGVSEKLPASVF